MNTVSIMRLLTQIVTSSAGKYFAVKKVKRGSNNIDI